MTTTPKTEPLYSSPVPAIRIQDGNAAPVQTSGEFVLYWMIAFRRTQWNFSLQRAVEWAVELNKPLVIFEPLRVGYRWASDRLHSFILDGMADNAARVSKAKQSGVLYYPYVEPMPDAGRGLLQALAERACVVVTDDFPSFFLPRMVASAGARLPVKLERVDGNGLLPLRSTERVFTTAFSFRAFLQKHLLPHLAQLPVPDPLDGLKLPAIKILPAEISKRWPPAATHLLKGDAKALAALPLDHTVCVVDQRGGASAAQQRWDHFLKNSLPEYAAAANEPDRDVRSGISAYLHFGHIGPHELFSDLMQREQWTPNHLDKKSGGRREGWWGVRPEVEAWMDQLITWRELGFNMASHCNNYDQYESLPEWSRATLEKHERDRRTFIYSLDEFASAETHDALWNAAQTQLVREGRIQNYLRMLWGKKILEWTATPRAALEVMIELNNRYALDGRDPNSYSGIFWCLGRYDRAWGPERPIFGKVRYMSSDNTARKYRVESYLSKYASVIG